MSLLDAKRRNIKEVRHRRGKTISEVILDLQSNLVHPSFARVPGPGEAVHPEQQNASLVLAELPQTGVAAQKNLVAAITHRHVVECQGLFAKEEKKANVREIVRDIMNAMAHVGPAKGRASTTTSTMPKNFELGTFMSDRRAPLQGSRRIRIARKPGGTPTPSLTRQKTLDKTLPAEETSTATAGDDLLAMALFGRHVAETMLIAILSWHEMVRRERYEKKRAAMQTALIWDDPERASVLMNARAKLVTSDRLSWFRVDTRNAKNKFADVRSAFPLTAPPILRGETRDDFAQLADAVRHLINDMVVKQQSRLSEQEHEVMERWILKGRSKDVRKLQRDDEDKLRRLEQRKRQLAQTPSFLSLIERMYLTCIVRSIENAAIFLSQIFSDTSCLQIRVMVVPHLPISGRGPRDGEPDRGVALLPSPTHEEVQTHLNALLQSVLTAATSVMTIREEVNAHIEERYDVHPSVMSWRAPTSRELHTLLMVSITYRQAVESLDRQLARNFKSVEQRLKLISSQFGVSLLTRIALLSEFYRDHRRLAKHMSKSTGDSPPTQSSNGAVSMPSFLLFWFSGPHAKLDNIPTILRQLFLCVAQLFSDSSEFRMVSGEPEKVQQSSSNSKTSTGKGEGKSTQTEDSGTLGFHSTLLAVAQGSACLADFILRQLIRLDQPIEASAQSSNLLHDLNHTVSLCNWFQAHVEQCQKWQDAVRELRIVYQCGPFALDTKYLSFVASQIASASLGSSIYLLNLYAVFNGKVLWRNVQNTVRELNQQVTSVGELVRQMQLLSGIYPLIEQYHYGKKQLERILYTLTYVVRDPLLVDNVCRLLGHHVQLDDHTGRLSGNGDSGDNEGSEGLAPGTHHPGGSLSTNLLFFLVKRVEETLGKLESRTDEVVATTARRVIPFHHKVQDEVMTVNSNARAIRVEMEQTLEPNPTLALDVRCRAVMRSSGAGTDSPDQEKQSVAESVEGNRRRTGTADPDNIASASAGDGTALDPEQQLTVGGIKNYADIEVRLANFEKRCRELESWRKLILEFEDFANQESISLSVPVVSIENILLEKLVELKVFWSSASEWDRSVDRYLHMRPDQVRINDVQCQAHLTLHAVRGCPKEHQKLFRERVDCFRRLLQPLFSVQVLISMSPSRELAANDSGDQAKQPVQPSPTTGSGGPPSAQVAVLGTASGATIDHISKMPGAPGKAHHLAGSKGGGAHTGAKKAVRTAGMATFLKNHSSHGTLQADVAEDDVVFAPEQNHIWEGLFGPVPQSTSERSGISEVVETIVNLRALVRTGALYRNEQVKHHYELAMQEMHVVHRLLDVVGYWSHKFLPIVPLAVSGKREAAFVVGSGSSLVQRLEEHITVIEELLEKSRVYGSHSDEEELPEGTSRAVQLTFVSSAYISLAREWHVRLQRMLEHCVHFLECQEEWLKMSVLLRCQVPPTGKGGTALRVADKEFRGVIAEMAEFAVLRHCFEDVLNSNHLANIAGGLRNAKQMLKEELSAMRCLCNRLFFVEDNLLIRLWGFSGFRDVDEQKAIVNAVIPKMFPGWQECLFASGDDSLHGLRVVGAGPAAPGTPLMLKHAVPLVGTPDQWVNELQRVIAQTFLSEVQELAPYVPEDTLLDLHDQLLVELEEADQDSHHSQDLMERHSKVSKDLSDGGRSLGIAAFYETVPQSIPDHIIVTVERIKWSALVESWSEESDGTVLLAKYIALQLNLVLRSSHRNGALISFVLECKDMIDRAQHDRIPASQLLFVRVGWKVAGHLAVGLDRVHMDFGWEFYGSNYLSCPVSERNLVVISQQLNSYKSTLLQGKLGGTVTQGFAAVCGIPCHEAYVLTKGDSLVDLYHQLLGCGLAGHWIVLQGIDNLEESLLNSLLKHLAAFFQQLTASVKIFADCFSKNLPTNDSEHVWDAKVDGLSRFLSCPPGVMRLRETLCLVDPRGIRLPEKFQQHEGKLHKQWVAWDSQRASSMPDISHSSGDDRRDEKRRSRRVSSPVIGRNKAHQDAKSWDDVDAHVFRDVYESEGSAFSLELDDSNRRTQASHSSRNSFFEDGSQYIPRVMHPRTAVFVAPLTSRRELKSFVFRIAAIHKADLLLYIRAGLIRAGIYDPDVAKTFCHAINAFNSYTGGHNVNVIEKQKFSKHLGVPEVRSVCSLAASLRRSRASQADSIVDDYTLLCEAWLCGISALLDATTERELLWHCTVLTFGNIPKFAEKEITFRQNLFNDTLVSQRFIKKDLNARLYDQIADTLKQKYSFFNPLIVQKCLATSNALLQQRHVAVVGEAGAGKTDCLTTLLEAGRHFEDDQGEDLFPKVRLLRINTIAHNTHHIIQSISRATRDQTSDTPAGEGTWLVLDGPLEPVLLASVSSPTPLHLLDADPILLSPLKLRMIIETDTLCNVSPAFASALALTFIDTNRGPTWKDKVVAWSHQLVGACPEYAMLMGIVRDLLVQLMDSILAFVLYYFHSAARDDSSASACTESSVVPLDYKHQTTSFLSYFTSLLLDPVIEEQLREAASQQSNDTDKSPLERHVRLLIAMASICSFGMCLFTHQRPRFERYVRERVLHATHAETLPPLYDLYFDSKTGTFQAVTELVRLSEPIVEDHCICVATEEFIAFQLRLRRLTAIAVPIMLAGTAGSGKSTLLRYLCGSPSRGVLFLLYRTSAASTAADLQGVVMHRLRVQDGAFLAPPTGKRFVVLIDDLHMSNHYNISGTQKRSSRKHGGEDSSSVFGGYSPLAEWMRFLIEHRGFYNTHDNAFMSVRDVSFLPTLLSPDSQSLPFCKRCTRHFFIVFMEIPAQESIEKIFSTVIGMNLSCILNDLVNVLDPASSSQLEMLNIKQQAESSKQVLIGAILEATLAVCKEADLSAKQRMHGLARVFCDLSHTFELVPTNELRSIADIGLLWAYAMRTFVLDAFLQVEQQHRRRQVYSAITRHCASSFCAVLGKGDEPTSPELNRQDTRTLRVKTHIVDPEAQAAELDALVYAKFIDNVGSGSRELVVQRTSLQSIRSDLLRYLAPSPDSAVLKKLASVSSLDTSSNLDMEPESHVEKGLGTADKVATASFHAFRELLSQDGVAASLWLYDDSLLSTLLRLCHTMYLHPVVCVIGGWAHFPLLGLASQFYGGEEVRMCTRVSTEALEKELLGDASSSDGKSHDVHASGVHRNSSDDTQDMAGQRKSGLRILAIDEEEVPVSALASFLHRERSRYFRPRHPHASALDSEGHPEIHTCVAIICRSPISFQTLATRCVFVQHVVSATFVLPVSVGFEQVALAYLPRRLSSTVPLNTLPKQQKRFNFMSKKSILSERSYVGSEVMSCSDAEMLGPGDESCGPSEMHKQFFSPLAQVTEALHARIQQCLQNEYGKEFANEYCTPYRFSQFLRTLARLALQFYSSQEFKTGKYAAALGTLESLRKLNSSLDAELRSVRVSLKLLIEEAGRLTSRVARVTAKRASARDVLAKTKKRQEALEARIKAVDARYGGEFSKAQHAVELTLRALGHLEAAVYEGLAKFIHPPLPIVRTLETVHTIVSYLKQLEEEVKANVQELDSEALGVGSPRARARSSVAPELPTHMEVEPSQSQAAQTIKGELEKWREIVATKDVLPCLRQWSTESHLPLWLSALLDDYVADPTCHPHALMEMNPAAAHMSAWLTARLNCHKVLDKIETKRQSMGDLSQQMSTLSDELTGATNDVTKAEDELKELQHRHTETVQQREKQLKDEKRLQDRVQRVRQILQAYSVRHREYETQAQNVHDRVEMPEQWGGLLHLATLSTYAAAFNPVVRKALMQDVANVFDDFDISCPKDLVATSYLKCFLPNSFLHLAESHWHDRYMHDSATMMELANTRCNIILDPFEQGQDWLCELYGQRYPDRPRGVLVPHTGEMMHIEEKQIANDSDAGQKGVSSGRTFKTQLSGQSNDGSSCQPMPLQEGNVTPQGATVSPTIINCGADPPVILEHIQRCIKEGSVLIIQCHAIAQLDGFIGDLLVLLQTVEACLSICTTGASADVRVRRQQRGTKSAQGSRSQDQDSQAASEVQLFDLLQQLERALPLPYRQFRVFVLVPRCSWNAVMWGPLRQKRAEQIRGFPAKLWSVCNIVSLDSRPVHPCRVMLNAFSEAKETARTTSDSASLKASFTIQNTQLQAVEDILANLLVTAEQAALDSEALHQEVMRFDACAKQLASSLADSSHKLRMRAQSNMERHLPLAGSAVVLMCALMSAEAARGGSSIHEEWHTDSVGIHRLNVHVDGFSIARNVLHQILMHLLRLVADPREALAEMVTMIISSMSERTAAILRVMLVLESGLVRQKDLAALWESLACHAFGQLKQDNEPSGRDSRASKVSSANMGKNESPNHANTNSVNASSEVSSRATSASHQGSGVAADEHERSTGSDEEEEESDGFQESEEEESELGSLNPSTDAGSNAERKADKSHNESLGFLEGEALMSKKELGDLVCQFCKVVSDTFPPSHPKRSFHEQLKRLPPHIPLMVPHNSISVVSSMAATLGVHTKEESAISMKGQTFASQVSGILTMRKTWLLFDLADVSDFADLGRALLQLQSMKHTQTSGDSTINWLDMPRLFLYCSAESTVVPRYILRLCFCVQSVLRFFGLRPPSIEDDDTLSSGDEEYSDEESISAFNSEDTGGASPKAAAYQYGTTHKLNARSSLNMLAMASEATTEAPLASELINYLSFTHPLLTVQALSSHDDKFLSVMGDIVGALLHQNFIMKEVVNCSIDEVPDWIEQHVVMPAQMWVQKSAVYAMLQTFSPTLIRQNDMQLKETLHWLSIRLSGMLQRVSATTSLLTTESPFWLLLELHRTAMHLQGTCADLAACYSALLGDVHWNAHLFSVYSAAAHGRAIWASSRPLATWLASLEEHVQFLTTWQSDSGDLLPFRIGSVSDIGSFFSSYSRENERFHLILERKPSVVTSMPTQFPKALRDVSQNLSGNLGGSSRKASHAFSRASFVTSYEASIPVTSPATTKPEYEIASSSLGRHSSTACLLVEGLHLLGSAWSNNRIIDSRETQTSDFEVDLPPMVIRPVKGPAPKTNEWYSCPLVVAHVDAFGTDVGSPPVAHVLVRTSMHPALCAVRGVRLVSYA